MPSSHVGEHVEVVPLTMIARAFPARPSALPDVRDFVRRQLTGTPIPDEDVRTLGERVAKVLLEGAGTTGSIQVSLRIFPESAEVDVLFAPDAAQEPADAPAPVLARAAPVPTRAVPPPQAAPAAAPADDPALPPSFAVWLGARLRAEGLTMEAAARRLGVSTKTISRWAAGTTEPRLRDLYRIREVFGEPPLR